MDNQQDKTIEERLAALEKFVDDLRKALNPGWGKGGRRSGSFPTFTDEDILDALRSEQAKLPKGANLGIINYGKLARHNHDLPSPALIIQRFGKWNTAKEKAGLRAKQGPGWLDEINHAKATTPEQALASLVAAMDDLGDDNPSIQAYDRWQQGVKGAVGTTTVRKLLGDQKNSWTSAKARARRERGGL